MDIEQVAKQIAKGCREVVQDALYQWELADAEREFFEVVFACLQELNDERKQ